MKKILLSAAALLLCSSTSAFALSAHVTKATTASPAKAWAAVGHFCGIASWLPPVTSCKLGMKDGHPVRFLSLKGGGKIEEEQISRNDKRMRYTYRILTSPLPVAHYRSTIRIIPHGKGSLVRWGGHFQAKGASNAKAVKVITGIYEAGVNGIIAKAEK